MRQENRVVSCRKGRKEHKGFAHYAFFAAHNISLPKQQKEADTECSVGRAEFRFFCLCRLSRSRRIPHKRQHGTSDNSSGKHSRVRGIPSPVLCDKSEAYAGKDC